jgi:hypothetical protein
MTRRQMIEIMDNDEFVLWSRFYSRKMQAEELERLKAGA